MKLRCFAHLRQTQGHHREECTLKSNWIKDMLQTLGLELDLGLNKEDLKLKKTENMLAKITKEKRSMENSYDNLKSFSKVNSTISGLFIFYNIIRFSWIGLIIAIGYNVISETFIKDRLKSMKKRIALWDEEILGLKASIDEMKLTGTTDSYGKSSPGPGKPYVDAEIIQEYPNQDTEEPVAEPSSQGTIQEAREAYAMLEKLETITASLDQHDHEMGSLFRNTLNSAQKVADFMKQNPANETKLYLFYNHVETLHDWGEGLLELENNEVYDSLLVNVKANARKALPILQAKIDKEYFKLVNPKIMDLEAEMEVMSKEQF